MRKFKTINLFIIIILAISLSLSGCNSKREKNETKVNMDEKQEINQVEIEEETREEADTKEELEEKEQEQEENQEDKDKKEESPQNTEKPTEKAETTKDTKDEPVEETANILKIEGKVGNELKLSLSDLKAMESIIFQGEYYSINNYGTTKHTKFKGVNLWELLNEKAQVSSTATKVSIVATDGYKMEFTIEQAKKQDYIDETNPDAKFPMIIAWEENGEEYDSEEGPPFKLVVGQKEPGDVNKPQWVSNIDKIIVE